MNPNASLRLRLACLAAIGALALTAEARAAEPSNISQGEFLALEKAGQAPKLVDVRTPEEFAAGHVPGAVNIERDQLPQHFPEFKASGKPIVVYCERGPRALAAADTLQAAGFGEVEHLSGDMAGWRAAGLPIEK
jgi:rhodanese-related sulfurtransferase